MGPYSGSVSHLDSLEFAKLLLEKARVSVSPGIGFGEYGDEYERFALIENEARGCQALRGIKNLLRTPVAAEGQTAK